MADEKKIPKLTPQQQAALRAARVRNYRIKMAHGHCDKCVAHDALYVVRDGQGEGDEAYGVRCERHIEGLPRAPGQREPGGTK